MIDRNGDEPIKRQAGTALGFINALKYTGTYSGLKRGLAAHQAMLGFSEVENHFPRPLPKNTGRINKFNDKYIYTTNAGWLDMAHFMYYAGVAYKNKKDKEAAQQFIDDHPILFFFRTIEEQVEIKKIASQNPVGEAVQRGFLQEKTDKYVAKHSAYSYEDLPSDYYGAVFGANYFDPNSNLTLGDQLLNYLHSLGATKPEAAPNYNKLPATEPTVSPSRKNYSTKPVYTKNNP